MTNFRVSAHFGDESIETQFRPFPNFSLSLPILEKLYEVFLGTWEVPGTVQASHPPSNRIALESVIDPGACQGVRAQELP